jgi:hypothetical protein
VLLPLTSLYPPMPQWLAAMKGLGHRRGLCRN